MCLEVLNYEEKFIIDHFPGLNDIIKSTSDVFWPYKTLSKF